MLYILHHSWGLVSASKLIFFSPPAWKISAVTAVQHGAFGDKDCGAFFVCWSLLGISGFHNRTNWFKFCFTLVSNSKTSQPSSETQSLCLVVAPRPLVSSFLCVVPFGLSCWILTDITPRVDVSNVCFNVDLSCTEYKKMNIYGDSDLRCCSSMRMYVWQHFLFKIMAKINIYNTKH